MTEESAPRQPAYLDERPESFAWHRAWRMALFRPTDETYQALLNDPLASRARADRWLGWAAIGGAGTLTGGLLLVDLLAAIGEGRGLSIPVLVLFIISPVLAGIVWATLRLAAVGLHGLAARFGGKGSLDDLWYALAAIYAPIAALIPAIALGPLVVWFMWLYAYTLTILVVKMTQKLDSWVKAVLTTTLVLIVVFLFVGFAASVVITLLGPTLGRFLFADGPSL